MKKNNQHILQSINFELNTRNKEFAFGIKDTLPRFLNEEILPEMEILFDEMVPATETRRLNSIDIELNVRSFENITELKGLILSQLKERLASSLKQDIEIDIRHENRFDAVKATDENVEIYDPTKRHQSIKKKEPVTEGVLHDLQNIFIYFLENGLMPWYANRSHFDRFNEPEYFQESFGNEMFISRLKAALIHSNNTLYRFANQCDENLVLHFLSILLKEKQYEPESFLIQLKDFSRVQRVDLVVFMLACLIEASVSTVRFYYRRLTSELERGKLQSEKERMLIYFIQQFVANINPQGISDRFLSGEKLMDDFSVQVEMFPEFDSPGLLNEGYTDGLSKTENKTIKYKVLFIRNSGLVIAHPFIWNLFVNTNCADKKGLFPEKISRAVHLLRFLAVGDEHVPEFELVFEKFLCGLPPEYPVDRELVLSDQEKMECEELLKSMIAHWPELKNSLPDTLRQMFLQRDGKLDFTTKPCKLVVERKAQDVLLEKLQWSISIVKIPSMNELLFVEW